MMQLIKAITFFLIKKKQKEENNFETLNKRIANAKRNIVKLKLTMASRFSENKNCDLESKRYAEKFTLLQNENKIRVSSCVL